MVNAKINLESIKNIVIKIEVNVNFVKSILNVILLLIQDVILSQVHVNHVKLIKIVLTLMVKFMIIFVELL